MKNYLSIVILLFLTLSLNAQAPQGFNYQATVRNSAGELIIKSNVYFKFNVFQGSQTAVPVFTETHYVPTDDLGQVTLVIGEGTANTGVFSEIDWSLGSYFLGIELSINDANNYKAMGTTQLLSVPYALYAANSGNATATTPSLETVLAQNNSANNQQIKELQDPTEAQDAVTKFYLDNLIENNVSMRLSQWNISKINIDNQTVQLTSKSFVFVNASNTTIILPEESQVSEMDVIYIYSLRATNNATIEECAITFTSNYHPISSYKLGEGLITASVGQKIYGRYHISGLHTIVFIDGQWFIGSFSPYSILD